MIYVIMWSICAVAIVGYSLIVYNRIVVVTNSISEAWANIASSIKKRHDAVPRLLSVVRVASDYEALIQKSQVALRSQDIQGLSEAERLLQKELIAIMEASPEVKADRAFTELFDELVDIENDIQANRLLFNRSVSLYIRYLSSFPSGVFAQCFGYTRIDFFEVDPSKHQVPGSLSSGENV